MEAIRKRFALIKNSLGQSEDIALIALRYVISNSANIVAIPGAVSIEQVIKNAMAGNELLSQEKLNKLRNVLL